MLQQIWERYLLRQFITMFFFFLCCFYGLYVLIDYASHASSHHRSWFEFVRYYLFVFASRAEILVPIALLIAFVKTICTLNTNHELVALMAGGFKLKTLMRPFLTVGFLCLILMFLNEQFILPSALKKLNRIENSRKHQKRALTNLAVKHLVLEDGSLLFFQNYDSAKERFFDVFWVPSVDNIYKIKFLNPIFSMGYFVDHLVRQPSGELILQESFKEFFFPSMKFNREILQSTIIDPETLSLTALAKEAYQIAYEQTEKQSESAVHRLNEKESKIMTAFYWKLTIPWLCLMAIMAPAPYCILFSRQLPIFLIYMCSLFGLIAFYMFIDAAQVIAKRQVIPPFWAICCPFLLIFSFFGWRFYKME